MQYGEGRDRKWEVCPRMGAIWEGGLKNRWEVRLARGGHSKMVGGETGARWALKNRWEVRLARGGPSKMVGGGRLVPKTSG